MKKWNLTKLSIDSFKVFNNFNDSFESDLIVFDGPNGYGKTTIFDALQLLFSGSIPRIPLLAKSIKVRSDKEFEANLYRHSKSDGDVVIKAEFKRGSESTVLVRMAKKLDIDTASNNKPDVFSIFKLFSLSSFDENIENASLIRDEKSHLQKLFGQFFLENYSVLNYMSQENNSLVIPNSGAQRFGQISHLLKLDNIVEKIENTKKLIATCRTKQNVLGDAEKDLEDQINQLNSNLTKKGNAEPTYQKLGVGENIAQWDKEEPIFDDSLQSYHVLARSIDLIKNIIENKNEIEIRIKNEKISSFITKDELPTAIRIGLHFRKYDALMAQRKSIDSYNVQYEMLDVPSSKIQLINIKKLTNTDDILLKNLVSSITNRDELNKDIDGSVKDSIHLNGMRKDILNAMNHNDNHEECPLCGFDYKKQILLLESIQLKTKEIERFINSKNSEYKFNLDEISKSTNGLKNFILDETKKITDTFEKELLDDLEKNIEKKERIEKISERILSKGISINDNYTSDPVEKQKRLDDIKDKILNLREKERDVLESGALDLFFNTFGDIKKIENIEINDISIKKQYLLFKYNQKISGRLKSLQNELELCQKKQIITKNLTEKLKKISDVAIKTKNDYSSKTIGHIESLFHIYSGRLLQNYQRGLGLFIDTEEDRVDKKNKDLSFFTPDGTSYDAILSMSSGQIAALTLSFFLALNRKYANTAFVLIDDPTQSMDEINIASLSDLLRVELKNRQVIISTHEQEVGDYLRYRYQRAGLKAKSINMQNISAS